MRTIISAAAVAASLCYPAAAALADEASGADGQQAPRRDIVVVGEKPATEIDNPPATAVETTAEQIATTTNAVTVEDTIKYFPSLIVRRRHIGDIQAPIATRTSGLGSSARSLIFADGAPLSTLIGNNNGSASPRWGLVTPEEIDHVEVLYGPFSAAYSGSSIGTVVNIVTRMPDKLEARLTALQSIERFSQYGTDITLPATQLSGSIGDRFGPLALFASATRTIANGQPLAYITAASAPAGTSGAFADLGRTGAPIKVLGAGGLEHHVQDTVKLKAALDLGDVARLSYVIALWHDDTHGTPETYLANAANQPVYTAAFSSNVYRRDSLHWSHVLNLQGGAPRLDWQVVGTVYDYARDIQRSPTGLLPAAFAGGAGNVQRMDGTGWVTLDTKAAWHADGGDTNVLSFGAHFDRYRLESDRYTTPDWTSPQQDALNQASRGKTRIVALWAQDAVKFTPALTLTLGARYEWWRAWNGLNFSTVPPLNVTQPERRAEGFSPKATLDWRPAAGWRAKASFGQAVRFPTVGELYQAITTGPTLTSPDPNLAPERARSEEVAIEHDDGHGTVRLSLFNEVVTHALISQSGTLPGLAGTFSFVQNVDRTRARGVELAIDRRDVVPTVDVSANVTYADAVTSKDTAFPAAVGKLLPSVPHWKANAVVTWRPAPQLSLTAAARYASRMYATIDNSDPVGNTYTGFYKYLVIDLRALFKVNDHFEFALGVDNLTNDKYFLFHPFPQRSLTAQVNWKL